MPSRKRGSPRPRRTLRGVCPICGDTVKGTKRRGGVELGPHGPIRDVPCSGSGARVRAVT